MSWQLLVGASVFIYSVNTLIHKILMKERDSDPYAQTIAFYGIVGILALIFALLRGGFQYRIAPDQLPLFAVITAFAAVASVLAFKALQRIEASEIVILMSSARLWVVLGAFLFLGEQFSVRKVISTMIILLGIAIAQWKKHGLTLNAGAWLALTAAACIAVTEITSFFILRSFDAVSFTVYTNLLPTAALLLINPRSIKKLSFYALPKNALNITVVSVGDFVATLLLFLAYQAGRNAAQIAPLMATQTIVSVLLAIVLLKERDRMMNKIVAATLAVAGVVLILQY